MSEIKDINNKINLILEALVMLLEDSERYYEDVQEIQNKIREVLK